MMMTKQGIQPKVIYLFFFFFIHDDDTGPCYTHTPSQRVTI